MRCLKISLGGLIAAFLLNVTLLSAQSNSSNGYFKVQCGTESITFNLYETPALQVSFAQIAGPLATAIATQQNQLIASGNLVSLWALKSDELQIHVDADPDETKLVVSSGICGIIDNSTANPSVAPLSDYGQATAVAIAQTTGNGQAMAYAQVIAGQAMAYAQASGNGYAYASAQSAQPSAPINGARTHVVQYGENLFRIALRYDTTVSELMRLNGISDAGRIYAGQVLILP